LQMERATVRATMRIALLSLWCADVSAHAVMTAPAPRPAPGMNGFGTKLQPFTQAAAYADGGCGGVANGDPGVQVPTIAYQSGQQLTVTWDLTLPHADDNLDSGVRIAVHYGAGDSFDQNILTGGVVGSGQPGTVSAGLTTVTVALPVKTCDYCTVQWIWAANQDGGSYIGCADVAITADGTLPNFAALPSQEGNVLPDVRAAATGPGAISVPGPPPPPRGGIPGGVVESDGAPGSQPSDGDTTNKGVNRLYAILAILALVFAVAGFLYYRQKKKQQAGAPAQTPMYNTAAVPPPPTSSTNLPAGWAELKDPASGATYYHHAATGEVTWTAPKADAV